MAIYTGKLNGIALCAGNGGLELGLKLALGEAYKAVCYVEREAYNARTLVARMEDAILDNAPIWDDIKTFRGKPWRGLVDIISAGFPCQPHSAAGKRKGTSDERWLWDYIERTIGEILPEIIFLENVPGLAFSGLDRVIGSLSEKGYQSVWDTFSAAETGASHIRERLFILSYRHGLLDRRKSTERKTRRNSISSSDRQDVWQILSDCGCVGGEIRTERTGRQARTTVNRRGSRSDLANDDGFVSGTSRDEQKGFSRRFTASGTGDFVFPPFRDDHEGWKTYLAGRPNFEPAILRGSDGASNRVDRLRTIGNGVVPIVAAYAFITLARTAFQLNL